MASIVRSTANRAVHLRIIPRPSNLGESREILRLISQFGEVEYFKNLKYDYLSAPNAALVIYKDEDAAQHCLRRSPIRFRMGKALAGDSASQQLDDSSPSEANPEATPSTNDGRSKNPFAQTSSSSNTDSLDHRPEPTPTPIEPAPAALSESRLYQIQVHPARVNFRDQINAGGYHGPFAIDTKSVAQGDLAKSVPLPGLSCVDWRVGDKPWRIIKRQQFREHESWDRRKSLRELYEGGSEAGATLKDKSPATS